MQECGHILHSLRFPLHPCSWQWLRRLTTRLCTLFLCCLQNELLISTQQYCGHYIRCTFRYCWHKVIWINDGIKVPWSVPHKKIRATFVSEWFLILCWLQDFQSNIMYLKWTALFDMHSIITSRLIFSVFVTVINYISIGAFSCALESCTFVCQVQNNKKYIEFRFLLLKSFSFSYLC